MPILGIKYSPQNQHIVNSIVIYLINFIIYIMLSIFAAGVVGYYVGLYTLLWSQLYTPHIKKIKDKPVPDNYLKYDEL